MKVLVTVGTTVFPPLVNFILLPSTLSHLAKIGVKHLMVQHGLPAPTSFPSLENKELPSGLSLETFAYSPHLPTWMLDMDLIVSHAGAGTILETLRAKKKLIVVINTQHFF
ncbi:N-acetylglucosaminyldiphosphodolichol N-acetylglucosaminyltransferase catalytic subunit alg13 [Coelomomyces lativittatus]|nr:N-acetylglucosaminyldiphosphodolichol N-acetylglucosaminyltransferase catalytic subunit alg13 [Coelomomyces lativittatus]